MNEYIVKIKKSDDSDANYEEFEFIVNDLVSAIEGNFPEGHALIKRNGLELNIESNFSVNELKDLMKPAFSYHFSDVRYVDLQKC